MSISAEQVSKMDLKAGDLIELVTSDGRSFFCRYTLLNEDGLHYRQMTEHGNTDGVKPISAIRDIYRS